MVQIIITWFCRFSLVLLTVFSAQAQPADTLKHYDLDPVVVTATRTAKVLRDVPTPTAIVTAAAAHEQGAMRLADLLAEQPGLALVHDHGTGLQLQGFDPAYTLILIDGEPVVGREAGTLDLARLTVAGIERIEVVRGPSSSLYGSEALAGVVNIITRRPAQALAARVQTRYETHETVDLTAEAEVVQGRFGGTFVANRYQSAGYDLFPARAGVTTPRFTDHTWQTRLAFDLHETTDLGLTARWAHQEQQGTTSLLQAGQEFLFENDGTRTDWSLTPRLVHRLRPGVKLTALGTVSRYQTDLRTQVGTDAPERVRFDQHYAKAEAQLDAVLGLRHRLLLGGGVISEQVEADRIRDAQQRSYSGFGFIQHEWLAAGWLDVTLSARLDAHNEYGTRFSPKAALLLKPNDALRFRASVGTGFKAPTFQQRYLDFINPVAGYAVFGSVDVQARLQRLDDSGQILSYLLDPSTLTTVQPETSVAVNLGGEADVTPWLGVQANVFRNNVRDLIEAAPVARLTNGQNAFTYFNLRRIYTQGVEAEVTLRPSAPLTLALGYQYLDAKDQEVVEALEAGTLFKRVEGRDVRVRPGEYGGLMNRSRHSGTLRLRYRHAALGTVATVRGVYRSRYGYADLNGNLILDADAEYVPGYWLWHATLTHPVGDRLTLQAGVINAFDETNPTQVPSLSGRRWFAGLRLAVGS